MPRARLSRSLPLLLLACLCLVPAIAFAAGIPIRGRILDAAGAPLPKVRVRLVPQVSEHAAGLLELEGKEAAEPVASAESGADGFFRLEAPETGMWKVVVGGDRTVSHEAWLEPLTGEIDLPAVRLQADTGITVRVLGPDGRPVPGARVRGEAEVPSSSAWSSTWQGPSRLVVTDAEGRAVLSRAGSLAVTVRAAASGFGIARRKEARAKTVELRLAAGSPLPLRVLGADGKPVEGVLVGDKEGAPLGVTGAGGLVELAAPAGTPLDVALLAADGRRLAARLQPFQAKEPRTPRELRLPAFGAIVARAVSSVSGRPVPGALVWWNQDAAGFRRADARGEARFQVPLEGAVSIRAEAAGYLPEILESRSVAGKPRQPLTVSLRPERGIAGIVVDEAGAPVGGAEITSSPGTGFTMGLRPARFGDFRAFSAVVRSGPDGRFRWGGLGEDATLELRVTKAGFAPTRTEAELPPPDRPAQPLRIILQRGRSAFGLVLGPDQRPATGAQVTLRTAMAGDPRGRFRAALNPEGLDAFEAVTGPEGRFDLANLPAGRYDLTAKGRGWAPLTIPNLEIPEGDRATDLGTLVLARGVALEGAVVDAAGRPVEGAEVRLGDAGERFPMVLLEAGGEPAGLSGADGFFRLEDLRGGSTVNLSATKEGYAPGEAQGVQVPSEKPLRIALQAVGSVSGRVVDPDGKPVAGALVQVDFRRGRGFRVFRGAPSYATSDSEGNFRLGDLAPGPVSLTARAAGWQDGTVAELELRGGEEKRGIEILLSPGALLQGRVLGPSGRAVADAEVQLAPEDRQGGFHMSTTDAEGHYVLDGLPPGLRTVEATHPDLGTGRRQVELRLGESTLDITLEGGSEVSGRVIDDTGAPVAGANVFLNTPGAFRPAFTTSRGDGTFRIPAVADGSYQAAAMKDGFAQAERVPVVVDGNSVAGIELRLTRGGAIVGWISGIEVAELARLQISARGPGMTPSGRVEADGSYRIDQVKEGEWRVRAELPGTALYAEGTARLEPGASEVRLDLEMERGFELSGRVRRNGAPVSGESLFLSGPQRGFTDTDADGRFRFQGLAAGTYTVRVGERFGHSGREETVELQDDREIIIDLPAADVRGRVIDAADSRPLSGVTVEIFALDGESSVAQGQTDSRGAFVLRAVAEGSWRLRAQADGYAPGEAGVQIDESGSPDPVELSLRATEGVTIQVTTATGLPPRTLFYAVLDGAGRTAGDGTAIVDESGRARLTRVPPGGWQVLLAAESTASLEITVTSPGDAGRVALPPPCTLRVRVPDLAGFAGTATVTLLGPGGRPFRTLGRFGEPTAAFEMREGIRNLGDVPPGTWDVQVTAGDGRTWKTTATTVPGVEAMAVLE